MARFTVQNRGGKLCAANKPKLQAFIDGMPVGKNYTLTLEPVKAAKTLSQLGYWHATVLPHTVLALRQQGYDTLGEVGFGRYTAAISTNVYHADLLLKRMWATSIGVDGLPSKADMTTEQMSNLIDFALQWVAKNLQYAIRDPEEK